MAIVGSGRLRVPQVVVAMAVVRLQRAGAGCYLMLLPRHHADRPRCRTLFNNNRTRKGRTLARLALTIAAAAQARDTGECPGGRLMSEDGSMEAAGAVDAATVALARYSFYRVPEAPSAAAACRREVPPLDGGLGVGARPHDSDETAAANDETAAAAAAVLICYSTAAYRRLARSVPRRGERTVDVGSAYGDATALMATAAGAEHVLGLDVGAKFVAASRAKFPALRFEQLDALEAGPGRYRSYSPLIYDPIHLIFRRRPASLSSRQERS